jgi:hypothetical protein
VLDETETRVYHDAANAPIDALRVVDAFEQCAAAER